MANVKKRLDVLLVERGLAESRQRAQAVIMSGQVYVREQKVDKAGTQVEENAPIEVRGQALAYVSRGGLKLEKALKTFSGIRLKGVHAIDAGASTGGFTDCMLQNGAEKVYAVDVGYGQLAWSLRSDPRVVCMERTNVRYLTAEQIPEPLDFGTVDVSFISLKLILPALRGILKPDGQVVCLVKPQFEAGREKVGKKGVVRDPAVHLEVLRQFLQNAHEADFTVKEMTFSPIRGPFSSGRGIARGIGGNRTMKVVLSPNPYRDRGLRAAQAAEKILRNVGVETAMCLPFLLEGSNLEFPKHIQFKDTQEELKNADMLVCFGGDGTILHAAKDANAHKVPILGVNLGSVGFMAELEQSELSMLSKLAAGKYTIESRMMLDVAVRRDGKVLFNDIALNDAALTKGAVARVVDLEVYGDKVMIANFSADGVIVSTPTGSTAYSMSAGGPIVEPTAENMIVTPICPHALSARSIVLGRERTVSIKMGKQSRKTAYLSVDGGKAFRLGSGDVVELKMSSSKTRLVRVTGRSFYDILSQKLGGAKA